MIGITERIIEIYKNLSGKRSRIAMLILFMLALSALGIAEDSRSNTKSQVPKPAPATHSKHSRKPTLRELYAMFLTYAVHVDTVSNTDEKAGKDRKFYSLHLQTAAGLTEQDYAQVLASAKRFVATDSDLKTQIEDMVAGVKALGSQPRQKLPKGQSPPLQIALSNLQAQRATALTDEISNLHGVLGTQRAEALDSYLQTKYMVGHLGPEPPTKYSLQSVSKKNQANPAYAGIDSGSTCDDYYFDDDGYMTICSDAQIAYLGSPESDLVEFYASMSASGDDPNLIALTGYSVEGDFFVDGVEYDDLDCDNSNPYSSCATNVQLTSGSGASYDWVAIGYASWDYDDECDGFCDSDDGIHESSPASVTIFYPDIASIQPSSLTAGSTSSGTFLIDGEGLISPFQNTPTVSVTDQGSIFSNFSVQSFDYAAGTITVDYTLLPNAAVGTQLVTVNNGFGSGTANLLINAAAPVINGTTVLGTTNNSLQAGTTQTVTLTGTGFGNSTPTITLVSGSQGTLQGVSVGSVTSSPSQTSVTFQVTTASNTSTGSVVLQLHANDNSSSPNALSPPVTALAMIPPPATISFGGNFVTDSGGSIPTPVVVGQQIYLNASVPSDIDPTSIDWTVPGTAVGGFTGLDNPSSGQFVSIQTEEQDTLFYWLYAGTTLPVDYTYCVDVNLQSCSTSHATFSVAGPTGVTMVGVPGPAELFIEPNFVDPVTGAEEPVISFGDIDNTPGMIFSATMSAPGGQNSAFFAQLINYDNIYDRSSSGSSILPSLGPSNPPALDHEFPIAHGDLPVGSHYSSSLSVADSPENVATFPEVKSTFSATMYLMWFPTGTEATCNPAAGDCAIPAPLGYMSWQFSGDAVDSLSLQNVENAGTTTINNTSYVLNSCSRCSTNPLVFVPSTAASVNLGYPLWTSLSQ